MKSMRLQERKNAASGRQAERTSRRRWSELTTAQLAGAEEAKATEDLENF